MKETQVLLEKQHDFEYSFDFDKDKLKFNQKNEFMSIRAYFDSLNLDQSHFVNSNDICTPMECVKEMVDSVPSSFWNKKDIKVLDSCCGNGNFHAYISTKISLDKLYFNEINPARINNLKSYFGDNINLMVKDFMEYETFDKYDLVVSNPPYAMFNEDGRTSKNHNLSRMFIKKALDITKDGGYILFIVPNNWMSFSDRNILPQELSRYQFVHLDVHGAKKWFPQIGSSFTWFLLRKVPNKSSFSVENNYVIKDRQKVSIKQGTNFIPLYLSDITMSILDKTVNDLSLPKYPIETTSFLHRTTQKDYISTKPDKEHCHKLIHTPSQILWSKKAHKYQQGWKLFISLTNQYGTFIDNCGMTQSIAFIRCSSKSDATRVQTELNKSVYVFINNITRYGNFNNIRVLQQFPVWGSFNLSQEEIEFIDYFNRQYYGK